MKIRKNKVVTMTYTLRFDDNDGRIIQEVNEEKPFIHLFGNGSLLPAFESNLDSLEPDAVFAFNLTPENGYGEFNKDAIIELDKSIFEKDGKIDETLVKVGNMITMQDQESHPIDGKVIELKSDKVVMDFNHPLAGQNLHFSGKIIDVREASEEELSHGHVHGKGGHHH
ncbi:MAG: peptidylprolyl isomerase [Bacteroidetes bacterium]|jgi:FKBP-type peptidyl-prolyl cis-trans isomerase SlyD|nr:peptidylprolyl isomerase [Bacteroidota bacterium]|tara:strand:+ start:1386 stop:1892 length:507 start_codon:yes stop_codon:yes gene_type:complete